MRETPPMIKKTKKTSLSTGDHIWVRGRYNFRHHGIVDRRGHRGIRVIHASKDENAVIVSTLAEFSGNAPIGIVAHPPPGFGPLIADRARRGLGDFYKTLNANCEHFAYEASTGVRQSPQLQRTIFVAGGLAILAILRREK